MAELLLSTLVLFGYLHAIVLIERLGDPRFRVRESATAALVELLRRDTAVVLLPLLEQAMRHVDPEVARRAGLAHEEFFNVWPSSAEKVPWLDMLPEKWEDRQVILDQYLTQARGVLGSSGGPDWPEYRLATAYYLHDRMRAGVSRSRLIRLLDEMCVNEQRYLSRR